MTKFGLHTRVAFILGCLLLTAGGLAHADDVSVGNRIRTLFPDQSVSFEGEWPADVEDRLTTALTRVAFERGARPADISELTILRHLSFRASDVFTSDLRETFYPNPAAIWGAGISGDQFRTITIKVDATEDQMAEYLGLVIPTRLTRDEADLRQWRRQVAQAYRPTFCGSVLGLFGLR